MCMKDLYFVEKKKIEYKNILNELTNIDTEHYTIDEAYIENGTVFVHGRFKSGIASAGDYQVFPAKYRPRALINGTHGCSYSTANVTKVNYVRVEANGIFSVWLSDLNAREHFNIQYPLKID